MTVGSAPYAQRAVIPAGQDGQTLIVPVAPWAITTGSCETPQKRVESSTNRQPRDRLFVILY